MKLIRTEIPDVVIVEPAVFGDDRGWFSESYNARNFAQAMVALGLPTPPELVQDNHSCSRAGVLRGLHYQLEPHAQAKLVRVVQGRAWDVAVDIRPGSPTFGRWVGAELSAANRLQLWIPAGFGHGFVALDDDTHFLYKTSDYYARDCERALRWNDPTLAIAWPLPADQAPLLAAKDAAAPLLADLSRSDLPAPWSAAAA
jgi:dTDP-4-dehydrorhamnose 3,5-epimerase